MLPCRLRTVGLPVQSGTKSLKGVPLMINECPSLVSAGYLKYHFKRSAKLNLMCLPPERWGSGQITYGIYLQLPMLVMAYGWRSNAQFSIPLLRHGALTLL